MDALRSVVARFAVSVDTSPLASLDQKIDKLKGNWGAMAFVATSALAGAAAASVHFIEAASRVEETQNKIDALFGKSGRDEIIAWSQTVEAEMGRAASSFQESFSDFAAFLDPMQIGVDRTIEFSKNLSKLSVDLASFYNTSEKEAQMRLFSGISGETEAVRRLGIDISDTSLAALFNSKENPLAPGRAGVAPGPRRNKGKGLASLTLAEKTQLRYYKIMKDTAKAQGDAARTAGGWANTLKRLTDRWKKFSENLGKTLKGPGVGILHLLESLVLTSDTLINKTAALQTAVVMLGGAAVFWTLKWAKASIVAAGGMKKFGASLLPILIPAAKLAAVFAIIESAILFLTDDNAETGFGFLAKAIEDIESPARVVRDIFKDWYGYLMNAMEVVSTLPEWLGGRGVSGRTGWSTDIAGRQGIDAAAAARRKARTEAMKADDLQTYVDNKRADQSVADAEAEFRQERTAYASTLDASQLTQNDQDLRSQGFGFARVPGGAGGGHITVAPVMNFVVNTTDAKAAEEVKRAAKDAAKETNKAAAQAARAALGRRGQKE